MKRLVPFWARISLIESPVEEAERDSGLIVPTKFDGDDGVKRGVVVDYDRLGAPHATEWWETLRPGLVVYYRGGTRIGDLILIEISDILAYEDEEQTR